MPLELLPGSHPNVYRWLGRIRYRFADLFVATPVGEPTAIVYIMFEATFTNARTCPACLTPHALALNTYTETHHYQGVPFVFEIDEVSCAQCKRLIARVFYKCTIPANTPWYPAPPDTVIDGELHYVRE